DRASPAGSTERRWEVIRTSGSTYAPAMVTQDTAIAEAARRWATEGWVVVDELIPQAEIDAAVAELPAGDAEPSTATNPSRHARPRGSGADDSANANDEPRFRYRQFSGTVLFPIPDAPHLNRLFVHPRLVAFARAALGDDDLRLYQARLWSKYAGRVDYAQPHHVDRNHSLVPTRSEPGFWHLECFIYLSDVEADTGAPRLVPADAVPAYDGSEPIRSQEAAPELYEQEIAAVGRAGSLLAYRSDVWHRGVDLVRPGSERHVAVAAFRLAANEWIGYDSFPPLAVNADFAAFVGGSTPDELSLFGFPRPGDPYWTPATVEAVAALYPALDRTPWQAALAP
ncbi:MAG: phytanoyl-CoA dioxygenase family protein, partial [Acidimicrobiales bacterium]